MIKQLNGLDTEIQGRPDNDYGEKANRDLIVTRGAGFRKEKNKKKRGSYRGGDITVGSLQYLCLTDAHACSLRHTASSFREGC